MRAIALIFLVASAAAVAEPQRQTFRDANGREIGRATTDSRGNTTYRNALGHVVALKVEDVAPNGYSVDRATVRQKDWADRPV